MKCTVAAMRKTTVHRPSIWNRSRFISNNSYFKKYCELWGLSENRQNMTFSLDVMTHEHNIYYLENWLFPRFEKFCSPHHYIDTSLWRVEVELRPMFKLTLLRIIKSITTGQISPAIVPIPLDIPMRILAYLGAMSKWFTLYPVMVKGID